MLIIFWCQRLQVFQFAYEVCMAYTDSFSNFLFSRNRVDVTTCQNHHTKIDFNELIMIYELLPQPNTYIANLSTFIHPIQTLAAIAILRSAYYVRSRRSRFGFLAWRGCGLIENQITIYYANTICLHHQQCKQNKYGPICHCQ